MFVSVKSYKNLLKYVQFLFKKRFEVNERVSIYVYAHTFFGEDF